MKKITDAGSTLLFILISLYALLHGSEVAAYTREALSLCGKALIPSLFPFMFLSRFFTETGTAGRAGRLLSPVLSPVFGVRRDLCGALLVGLLGGFPNGAYAAGAAYASGKCSRSEAERIVALADNASFAFLLTTVGVYVLGSLRAGFILAAASVLTVLTNAWLLRLFYPTDEQQGEASLEKPRPMAVAFCASLRAACHGILYICGYVTVFYTFSGALTAHLAEHREISAVVHGLLELSGAVVEAADFDFPRSYVLCAAFVGFSGLCVWFQVSDICHEYGLSARPFVFTRLSGCVLCPCFTALLLLILPVRAIGVFATMTSKHAADIFSHVNTVYASAFALLLTIGSQAFVLFKKDDRVQPDIHTQPNENVPKSKKLRFGS